MMRSFRKFCCPFVTRRGRLAIIVAKSSHESGLIDGPENCRKNSGALKLTVLVGNDETAAMRWGASSLISLLHAQEDAFDVRRCCNKSCNNATGRHRS